jgi:hypothetical protein
VRCHCSSRADIEDRRKLRVLEKKSIDSPSLRRMRLWKTSEVLDRRGIRRTRSQPLMLHQKWAISRTFRNRGGSYRLSVRCLQLDKSSEDYSVVARFLRNRRARIPYSNPILAISSTPNVENRLKLRVLEE